MTIGVVLPFSLLGSGELDSNQRPSGYEPEGFHSRGMAPLAAKLAAAR